MSRRTATTRRSLATTRKKHGGGSRKSTSKSSKKETYGVALTEALNEAIAIKDGRAKASTKSSKLTITKDELTESAVTPAMTSRQTWPESERGTPAWLERLKSNYSTTSYKAVRDLQLKSWSKSALCWQAYHNATNKETAEYFGVKQSTFESHRRSDAGKTWREKIEEVADDMVLLTGLHMKAQAFDLSLELLLHHETAKEAGDYKEAHRIAKTMLDYADLAPKKEKAGPTGPIQITLSLGGATVKEFLHSEADTVEAEFEVLDDGDRPELRAGRPSVEGTEEEGDN